MRLISEVLGMWLRGEGGEEVPGEVEDSGDACDLCAYPMPNRMNSILYVPVRKGRSLALESIQL